MGEAPAIRAYDIETQRLWSIKTFGPGHRTEGVIDHIRKELEEITQDPLDLKEWVDILILALDGAWRAGWRGDEIVRAYMAKMEENRKREWPDWRTAEPGKAIEHVREVARIPDGTELEDWD